MDEYLTQFLNGWVGHSPMFDLWLYFLQDSYLVKGLFAVGVLVALYGATPTRERRSQLYATLILVFAAMVLAQILQGLLPYSPRPFNTAGLEIALVAGLENTPLLQYGTSFPSDHAVMFWTLCACVLLYAQRAGLLLLAHALVVISLPRIMLGFHWTSDILGGAVIGVSLAVLLQRPVAKWLARASDGSREHSPLFYALLFVILCETATMYVGLRSLMSLAGGVAKLLL